MFVQSGQSVLKQCRSVVFRENREKINQPDYLRSKQGNILCIRFMVSVKSVIHSLQQKALKVKMVLSNHRVLFVYSFLVFFY